MGKNLFYLSASIFPPSLRISEFVQFVSLFFVLFAFFAADLFPWFPLHFSAPIFLPYSSSFCILCRYRVCLCALRAFAVKFPRSESRVLFVVISKTIGIFVACQTRPAKPEDPCAGPFAALARPVTGFPVICLRWKPSPAPSAAIRSLCHGGSVNLSCVRLLPRAGWERFIAPLT